MMFIKLKNRYLDNFNERLHNEIILLAQNIYHVYDDEREELQEALEQLKSIANMLYNKSLNADTYLEHFCSKKCEGEWEDKCDKCIEATENGFTCSVCGVWIPDVSDAIDKKQSAIFDNRPGFSRACDYCRENYGKFQWK